MSTKFLAQRLASKHSYGKHQDKVRMLRNFERNTDVCSSDSGRHWRNDHLAWFDGACIYSLQLERIHQSQGCSYDHLSILKTGLEAGGKESKFGRQTIFYVPFNLFGDDQDDSESSFTAIGKEIKMLYIEWNCQEHKILDCNVGRKNPMP